ncbi:hypothetical protein GCM10023201_36120 [Actinomycetospora corticicola]|uniref:DUF5666 domain-containing protein n=1 Tax=Actinomycetospora corticicola TaxID=663602 RepID=A0A7Y9E0X7_9PSEU|nr:hypothetical protein [Actinomycetospora corticicola]NYD39001.1 hypothetical protein [Actinomycetospora corticicola]
MSSSARLSALAALVGVALFLLPGSALAGTPAGPVADQIRLGQTVSVRGDVTDGAAGRASIAVSGSLLAGTGTCSTSDGSVTLTCRSVLSVVRTGVGTATVVGTAAVTGVAGIVRGAVVPVVAVVRDGAVSGGATVDSLSVSLSGRQVSVGLVGGGNLTVG